MKQFFHTTTSAIFVLIFSHHVIAQCPTCDAALVKDTRDYYHTVLNTDFKDILTEIFSHDFSYYKSGAWKSNTNFQSGGAYGVISGFLDGSKTDDQNETAFDTEKSSFNLNHDISQSVYLRVSQSIQSPIVYKTWLACVQSICNGKNAPFLEKVVAGNELTITLFWPNHNSTDRETINDITFGNLTPERGGTLVKNKQIVAGSAYQRKFKIKDINAPSYVSVTISEFGPILKVIEAVPKENLASNYPIGTIIASVLDWKTFCALNGQSEVIDDADSLHCKWVPADGRSVQNSRYGHKLNSVPDLRGVFLRGLNDFEVEGVQSVNPEQKDPDPDMLGNKRVANSLQKDAFANHSHPIKRASPGDNGGLLGGNSASLLGGTYSTEPSTTGGKETRPTNKAVYYYIKIN